MEKMPADDDDARLAIFEKYEAGREGGVQVEDWEDPNLKLYALTDRYGFMHKDRLPPTHPNQKDLELMRQRALKWNKMLGKWNGVQNAVMRRRVFKGIPDGVRLEVWKRFLNLEEIRKEGQYEAAYFAARERGLYRDIDQIDKDVRRRFREHVLFRESFGQGQQILFRILAAYTMYNTEIGYCQGMDAIAGLLMMYMSEEDAYWALCRLMSSEKYAMHGLYVSDLRKLHEMLNHHNTIRRKVLPKVNKHLEHVGFEPSLYGTKWFMEGFQEMLPFPLVLRIWDVYLYLGEPVMHAMAALLLKLFKKQMTKQSFEQLHQFTKELPGYKFDNDDVMDQLDLMLQDLNKQKLASLPRATSLQFLPTSAPPSYPQPPSEYRNLSLRREQRLTIRSLPTGVSDARTSYGSESSGSEGPRSPDSTASAPTIVPVRHNDESAAASAASASPADASLAHHGLAESQIEEAAEENAALQAATESLAEADVMKADRLDAQISVRSDTADPAEDVSPVVSPPSAQDRPSDLASPEVLSGNDDVDDTAHDVATPTASVPNGDVQHDKEQLAAANSDASLRVRVSTL